MAVAPALAPHSDDAAGDLCAEAEAWSTAEVSRFVVESSSRTSAELGRQMILIGVLISRGSDAVSDLGYPTLPQWLVHRTGLSVATAREHVRVASRLRTLPLVRSGLRAGALSWSKARSLARAATPSTEADLVAAAGVMTAVQLERLARMLSQPSDDGAAKAAAQRRMRLSPIDDLACRIDGVVTIDEYIIIKRAFAAVREAGWQARIPRPNEPQDPTVEDATPGARDADALITICQAFLAMSARERAEIVAGPLDDEALAELADRAHDLAGLTEIVVHADLTDVAEVEGVEGAAAAAPSACSTPPRALVGSAHIEGETSIARVVAQRLACGARRRVYGMRRRPDGGVDIELGRSQRLFSRAQRRSIWLRDRGCAYPDCGVVRGCQLHHILEWEHDGPTNTDNGVMLCRSHHRLVHEHAWTVEIVDGRALWATPDTQPYQPGRTLLGSCGDPVRARRDLPAPSAAGLIEEWDGHPLDGWAISVYLEALLPRIAEDRALSTAA